jgi:hypothetical protein
LEVAPASRAVRKATARSQSAHRATMLGKLYETRAPGKRPCAASSSAFGVGRGGHTCLGDIDDSQIVAVFRLWYRGSAPGWAGVWVHWLSWRQLFRQFLLPRRGFFLSFRRARRARWKRPGTRGCYRAVGIWDRPRGGRFTASLPNLSDSPKPALSAVLAASAGRALRGHGRCLLCARRPIRGRR